MLTNILIATMIAGGGGSGVQIITIEIQGPSDQPSPASFVSYSPLITSHCLWIIFSIRMPCTTRSIHQSIFRASLGLSVIA